MKHLLKLLDWSSQEIMDTLNLADQLKYELKHGIEHKRLAGKTLGMIFQKSSTRTRVSFEVNVSAGRHAHFPLGQGYADWQRRARSGYRPSAFPLFERHYDPHL